MSVLSVLWFSVIMLIMVLDFNDIRKYKVIPLSEINTDKF